MKGNIFVECKKFVEDLEKRLDTPIMGVSILRDRRSKNLNLVIKVQDFTFETNDIPKSGTENSNIVYANAEKLFSLCMDRYNSNLKSICCVVHDTMKREMEDIHLDRKNNILRLRIGVRRDDFYDRAESRKAVNVEA